MYISKNQSIIRNPKTSRLAYEVVLKNIFQVYSLHFVLFLYFRPTTTITKPTTDVLPPQPIANQKSYFFLNVLL